MILRANFVRFWFMILAPGTKVLVKAIGTHLTAALTTRLEANHTNQAVTTRTGYAAARTAGFVAMRTITGTVAAKIFFTAMAAIPLLLVDRGIAVVARHAVPVLQFDVSSPLGIGLERLMHNREEVVQPAGG